MIDSVLIWNYVYKKEKGITRIYTFSVYLIYIVLRFELLQQIGRTYEVSFIWPGFSLLVL